MGALVATVGKRGANVFDATVTMLETLSHRGSDAFGIASPHKISTEKTVEELRKKDIDSNALIGYDFAKILPRDNVQPVQKQGFAFVLDGRLFPVSSKNEVEFVAEEIAEIEDKAMRIIRSFDGDYVFAMTKDDGIAVGRDSVGACPLYFGENEDICAVASERKALWKIGITGATSFPPGKFAVINDEGFTLETARVITQPPLQEIDEETAIQRLKSALLQSVGERISDVNEAAVAFSGGLDSSVIAFLTKLCGIDAHLICVELEGQKETAFAERAAETLDLPIHVVTYSSDDLEEDLLKVLWLVEEPSPLNTGIAVPVFWIAEQSAKLGFHVLLAGQGSDELFGGYRRYLESYAKGGAAGLQRRLYEDVVACHETNFQRDNKVCSFHRVELRLPFADWEVIQLALSFPARLKIASPRDALRKKVLRRTATMLGIPESIAEKPKKAIQYTTGVNQALKGLAKKKGLTLREYVEKAFKKAYKTLE